MRTLPLNAQTDYIRVMAKIENIFQKSTDLGGFDKFSFDDAETLSDLSFLAAQFEDNIPMMPILK